jgi:hypothetical protein
MQSTIDGMTREEIFDKYKLSVIEYIIHRLSENGGQLQVDYLKDGKISGSVAYSVIDIKMKEPLIYNSNTITVTPMSLVKTE